jgi:ABC-type multidrug transport system fused ATPase/permease subunit
VVPRYVLEVLAFGAVLLILGWETQSGMTSNEAIPLLGLYAFAGFRLLPKMQGLFYALSSMRFTSTVLDAIHHDLVEMRGKRDPPMHEVASLQREFGLTNLTFVYEGAHSPALNKVTMKVPFRASVGLVGSTGSGKTTAMDLMLGLLSPTEGGLVVDGRELSESERIGWRRQCGYVPQQIFLSDDTIAANIAFGVHPEDVDLDAVKKAAHIASLDEFVESLRDGYETEVGERGVRLSGGQRQRIGIARALYYDPEVLFFDEATSALDNATEQAIMDALENLAGMKTIIMIAHRLSTVKNCDVIYVLKHGEVVDSGSWLELKKDSSFFRETSTS